VRSRPPVPPEEPTLGGAPMGRLDGYELVRLLGQGGMGRVYLARQVSLDRLVAVKTIDPELARDAGFVARFVREAYAVAQLSHHNVVQVHDIGQADDGTHYYSMEYVAGQSLSQVARQHGQLDPEEAATYILHAARGLKFAHEHDMVHRDVKPSNLLLNDQGLIKVADLGVVKTPGSAAESAAISGKSGGASGSSVSGASGGSGVTSASGVIGTPAYMAPEQATDAASVDGRADVYSLGATFYHLITGRPPFEGESSRAVIQHHAKSALVPPERIAPRTPQPISAMIQRMLAKKPEDRYANMGEVVEALQAHLGVEAGPFTPRTEHSSALEMAVGSFNKETAMRVRRVLVLALHLGALLAVIVGAALGNFTVVGGAIGLWASTVIAYQLLAGIVSRSILIRRARQYAFSIGWKQWLMALGGVAAVCVVVWLLGLMGLYLGTLIAGVVLAAGFYFTIDVWASRETKPHVEGVRRMLKDMRLRGLEEEALRRFVCRYSGKHWEAFYEALFGYEAKLDARRHWGHDLDGRPRPRHAGWRDALIEWFDRRQREHEEAKQRRHLQRVEMQRLRAEGKDDQAALAEARKAVSETVDRAAKRRGKARKAARAEAKALAASGVAVEVKEQWHPGEELPESWKLRRTPLSTRVSYWVLGAPGRFITGVVLFGAWALWARQRKAFDVLFPNKERLLRDLRVNLPERPPALDILPIPDAILNVLCSHTAGLAGLILLASVIFRGRKMTFFLLPTVALLLRAPFQETHERVVLGLMTPFEVTVLIALALVPFAFFFGRSDN